MPKQRLKGLAIKKDNLQEYLKFKEKYENLQKIPHIETVEEFKARAKKIKHVVPKNKYKIKKEKRKLKKNQFKGGISSGERRIQTYLDNKGFKYQSEQEFKDLINPKTNIHLRFDFYLPDLNTCIEYDGKQHFEIVPDFHGDDIIKAKKKLKQQKYKDSLKNEYCKLNNIKLIRISYKQYMRVNNILDTCLFNS